MKKAFDQISQIDQRIESEAVEDETVKETDHRPVPKDGDLADSADQRFANAFQRPVEPQ